jgi:ABC-type polysaccharide/polyol phosphate transport system ATPase subunit
VLDVTNTAFNAPVDAAVDTPVGAASDTGYAIDAQHIAASYRIRLDETSIWGSVQALFSRRQSSDRLIPALRDVSFTVKRGSVLAVIGRNGAGKSTLLRVIGGILVPDSGRVRVRGRLSLLAPGLGFSENLTGRQNIELGALAIGLPAERLEELTDVIADFAQLEGYVDLPLRAYSAGMRMRLATAIAAHLDPEILLIDEALAGGDAAFVEHTQEKMAQLTGMGRTIVIVTHGLSTVQTMATEAMWMHQGRVEAFGDPDEVVSKYMRYCRLEHLRVLPDEQ